MAKKEKPIMIPKRILMESVARMWTGATLVLADEGPRENAPKSDPTLTFIRAFCLQLLFKNVLPTDGGAQIL